MIVTQIPKIVAALAVSGAYDVVIYGHTHKAEMEKKEDKALMIKPGECCGRLTIKRTVVIPDLEKYETELVKR
ncbi:hypothetical protein C5S53_16435 [Methanophagales archaeon]|nr:hypothetical protein C5S53_16435 [Methanophagales archaeon]